MLVLNHLTQATNLRLCGLALILGTAVISVQSGVVIPVMGIGGGFLPVLLIFALAAVDRIPVLALAATLGTLVLTGLGVLEGIAAASLTVLLLTGLVASAIVSKRTRSVWPQGLMAVGVSIAVLGYAGAQSYAPPVLALPLAASSGSSLIVEALLEADGLADDAPWLSRSSLLSTSCVALALFGPTQLVLLTVGAAALAAAIFRWLMGRRDSLLSLELAAAGLLFSWALGAAGAVLSLGFAALLIAMRIAGIWRAAPRLWLAAWFWRRRWSGPAYRSLIGAWVKRLRPSKP